MNKRIRKKRERRQLKKAIQQLVTTYDEWERQREEKMRYLEEKYSINLMNDPQNPFGLPLIVSTPAIAEEMTT